MRLPNRPAPQIGELLSGYLSRLAVANALRPAQLHEMLGVKGDPDVLSDEQTIASVAICAGQAPEVILGLLLSSLLPLKTEGKRRRVMGNLLLTPGRVYGQPVCPVCLTEAGVFHREWRLSGVTVCEQHQVHLIDHCGCGAPVSVGRRFALSWQETVPVTHCDVCGRAYPTSQAPVPLSVLTAQRFVLDALRTGRASWENLWLSSFEAVDVLGFLAYHRGQRWELRRMTVDERRETFSAVGEVLLAGPEEFFKGLRVSRGRAKNYTCLLPESAWVRDLTLDLTSPYPSPRRVEWAEIAPFSFSPRQRQVIGEGTANIDVLEVFLNAKLQGEVLPTRGWWASAWLDLVALAHSGQLDRIIETLRFGLAEEDAAQARQTLATLTAPSVLVALQRLGSRHHEALWEVALTESLQFLRASKPPPSAFQMASD